MGTLPRSKRCRTLAATRGRKNSREFDESLMDGGDKVRGWSARPYTEPDWDIMRMLQHHPPPSVWIDVTLNDGTRDYPIYLPWHLTRTGSYGPATTSTG